MTARFPVCSAKLSMIPRWNPWSVLLFILSTSTISACRLRLFHFVIAAARRYSYDTNESGGCEQKHNIAASHCILLMRTTLPLTLSSTCRARSRSYKSEIYSELWETRIWSCYTLKILTIVFLFYRCEFIKLELQLLHCSADKGHSVAL